MPKKILIVDDEPDIVMMTELRIKALGYDTITAKDGQEALNKAKQEMPDLIILDVMMPKMDGYKVCGLLKSDSRYKNIPIILFTARAQEVDRQTSVEVGADAYLNKPLNAEQMSTTIKELLEKKES